jgi:hypothetical protein
MEAGRKSDTRMYGINNDKANTSTSKQSAASYSNLSEYYTKIS